MYSEKLHYLRSSLVYNLLAYTKVNKLKIVQGSFRQIKESLLLLQSFICEECKSNSSRKKPAPAAVTYRVELNYLRFCSTKQNGERRINVTEQERYIHSEQSLI